jgi:hypothetical protein
MNWLSRLISGSPKPPVSQPALPVTPEPKVKTPAERRKVVQLYVRDVVSSVTRPVKELKGFRRVSLKPGERTTVGFDVTPAHLALWDIAMQFRVEPGEFRLMVGNSSRSEDLQTVTPRVKGDEGIGAWRQLPGRKGRSTGQ